MANIVVLMPSLPCVCAANLCACVSIETVCILIGKVIGIVNNGILRIYSCLVALNVNCCCSILCRVSLVCCCCLVCPEINVNSLSYVYCRSSCACVKNRYCTCIEVNLGSCIINIVSKTGSIVSDCTGN